MPPDQALAGLLHDASEGLGMSDVVSPLKKLLPDYKRIERGVMQAVARRFGLTDGFEDHAEIKLADLCLLHTEQVELRKRPPATHQPRFDLEVHGLRFECLLPAAARLAFLDRYREIVGAR